MKKKFSTKWKGSIQPRKQRKYRHNAPLHIKGKFINVHLDKELAKKHSIRRIRLRVGDKVKIMRGKFKGKEGKIDMIALKNSKAIITGIEISKKEGSKTKPLIHASNLLIIELNLDDKKRLKRKKVVPKTQNEQSESSKPGKPGKLTTSKPSKPTNGTGTAGITGSKS